MRQIFLLITIALIVSCKKDNSGNNSSNLTRIYDKQYFSGLINGNSIDVSDTLNQIGFQNDLLDIEGYKKTDSVLWRFATWINVNNSNSSIQINFFQGSCCQIWILVK